MTRQSAVRGRPRWSAVVRAARRAGLAVALATLLAVGPARAQPAGLACYKTKDALRLAGTADLDTPQFGVDPGCKISRAKLFCAPAGPEILGSVIDKSSGIPIVPLSVSRAPQSTDQICYKVKCPASLPIADQPVTDEFGNRTTVRQSAALVCVPAVHGGAYCGDGTIDPGESCEPTDLGGASCTSLGFTSGTLACRPGCTFDTSGCASSPPPGTCGNGTIEIPERCDGADLGGATCTSLGYALGGTLACTDWCAYDTSRCVRPFPATGQTMCWNAAGTAIPCAGTGQDGDVQAGATLAYGDNGDGTITDTNTGLVWEKLADDGSIHDKDDVYPWTNAFSVKIAALNTVPCFAGHCDWRVPNLRELASLQNLGTYPSVSPAFDAGCIAGCTVLTCSCTNTSQYYWSSSAYAGAPSNAWVADFGIGLLGQGFGKDFSSFCVRAVRGGS
jgi:uncharacterized protein DUF1566